MMKKPPTSPLHRVYGAVRLGEKSITRSRPVVWAMARASPRPKPAGSCLSAIPKQRKIPNQMMAIWTTSVQITDRFPP